MAEGYIQNNVPESKVSLSSGITFINGSNYDNRTFISKTGIIYSLNVFVTINDTTIDATNWIPLLSHNDFQNASGFRFTVYNATKNVVGVCRLENDKLYLNPTNISVGDIIYGSITYIK